MKIGVIVFSDTGNTLVVAEALSEALTTAGHESEIQRVTAESTDPNSKAGKILKNSPDVSGYDIVVFGAPVWAFSLSGVMKQYLNQISTLKGKKIACFVTQGLSKKWLGGNRSIKMMRKICTDKGGIVYADGIVHATGSNKEQQTNELIKKVRMI